MAEPFPLPVRLDVDAQRLDHGRVLLGGSPAVLFRLGRRGQAVVDAIERDEPLDAGARPLVERLLDAGAVHPHPRAEVGGRALDAVTVVVPAYGALRAGFVEAFAAVAATIVVDDGSPHPTTAPGTVVRHPQNQGPAAARNTGLAEVRTDLVACIDTDCVPSVAWIAHLLGHFADPRVALVAPRITSPASPDAAALARYEASRSPLDLGDRPGRVAPGTRVAYVPGAAFVARTTALRAVGGFDTGLRVGEDVDLVWRLHAGGWRIRYDPSTTVDHVARTGAAALLRQRFAYGTSAGPLAERHGRAVVPVRVTPTSIAGWGITVTAHPLAGVAVGLSAAVPLARRIGLGREGALTALAVATHGHLAAGRQLASALTRPWWPLAAGAALVSRRARLVLALAVLVPALLDHRRQRPALDPVRYTLLRVVDDLAYGAGVWRGAIATRRATPFLPDLSGLRPPRGSGRRAPPSARPPTPRRRPPPAGAAADPG